jgi:hypothetical protein
MSNLRTNIRTKIWVNLKPHLAYILAVQTKDVLNGHIAARVHDSIQDRSSADPVIMAMTHLIEQLRDDL